MIKQENSELDKRVGKAVAHYRKMAGLSQAEVAEIMGLSNDAISKMERGNITLNVSRLFEFAQIFNCQASDFLIATSNRVEDQHQHLSQLLLKLNSEDRGQLLRIIEQMISWKQDHNSMP
ncbi:XRE family transcriptional regulator [Vespertiliibacter pulmonis]|uniref:Transcriptional regulator with XRE-family HTH domain n=1 Tax=Vespertiliibacter pulmonis TaxID=1443036 RepID=A0A3N4VWS6_9PAST|nr:helix-turn-helix transcriptional regulator [Vespertiliibacter pulmonis]QLB20888.1 XRE family transcriptional regulator [Vespertiliibacter pulmonis]RPE83541.1 transcriptional regulator with XRE-family HTH domain [Vespertiliibacter pulmonis]